MDGDDLVLSAGPPTIAILLQIWGIPSRSVLARNAANEGRRTNLQPADVRTVELNTVGAVSLSNLASTFISFPSAVFALFHSLSHGVIFVYATIIVGLAILLWAVNVISGMSMYELALGVPSRNWLLRKFPNLTAADLIDWTVYVVNGLLITLAIGLYVIQLFPPRVRSTQRQVIRRLRRGKRGKSHLALSTLRGT